MEKTISNGSAHLWTSQTGDHGSWTILCNGGPGCCDYLEPAARLIDDRSRVIRWEQRGCGRSTNDGDFHLATAIADLECIRANYGIERWFVGGHSWGPDLALAYALTHPERTQGIIGLAGGVVHKDQAWRDAYREHKHEEPLPEFRYPYNLDVNRVMNGEWLAFCRQSDLLRRIADLDVPALFIAGGRDIRPWWPIAQLAGLLPRGRFELLPEAGHLLYQDAPAAVQALIRDFLSASG